MCCGSRKVWTVQQFFWHLEIRGGFLMQEISELLYIVSSDLLPPLLLSLLPFLPLSYVTTLRVCWLSDVQILCHPSLTASALRWPQIIHLTAHETTPPALLLFWSILTKKNPLWSVFAACCNLKREEWERVEVGGGLGPTSWCHGCSRVTLSWDLHMCSRHWLPDCWHANNMQFIVYISFSLCKSTSLDTW